MLSALLIIPFVGVFCVGFLPTPWIQYTRQAAIACLALTCAWSLYLLTQFDISQSGYQLVESIAWLDTLGLNYKLAIDGFALPLILINSLLSLIAVYSSDENISRPRLYYALLLTITGAVAGAFLSQNMLLFFLFYELELIPLYLLIAIWGGARRGYAATKFLIYTAISGILILAAFLGVAWLSGTGSFDYSPDLARNLTLTQQVILLIAILVGFGIKIPLFPFHTWLPDAHVEASTPISVLLAGVLLKLGTYGLVRFGLELFPDAWQACAPWLAWWAVVSVLYGSLAAIAQTDMKKMVAYSSVGHMGYILLACAATNPLSVVGASFQMVSHGLISGLLFLLVGVVYKKTGTRDMTILRGLLNPERGLPITGSLMVLGVMASAGIPGMAGFVAEFIIFRGSFATFTVQTLLCMIGTGLTAVYFLLLVNRVFFGRLAISTDTIIGKTDVLFPFALWRERLPALVLATLIVLFGLSPAWVTRWMEPTLTALTNPQLVSSLVQPYSGI
jgi:NAD(P)H-quinone oxidoreductase subunit 4